MLIGYVDLNAILERVHRVKFINDTNASYIKEFAFDGLLSFNIDDNELIQTADLDVSGGKTLLPPELIDIEAVYDMKSGIELVSRKRTEGFIEGSFYVQGRVLFTDFSEGVVKVVYRSLHLDEDGNPMIPDNQYVIDAMVYHILWKVAELGVLNGTVTKDVEVDLAKKAAFGKKAAKDFANRLGEPEHKAMQKYTLRPYLDATRRRRLR